MEVAEKSRDSQSHTASQDRYPTVNLWGECLLLTYLQLASDLSEFLAFGRGITRKLQGFRRNRNIFGARR
jgi:hypothetical protein